MPATLEGKLTMFTNIQSKVGSYQAALPLTAGLVTEIEEICSNYIGSFDFVENSRATRQAVTSWRDILLYGEPVGDALPAAPVFANIGAVTGTIGIIPRFREIRELIVASPGYTEAIGDDLIITGSESGGPVPEGSLVPSLTLTVSAPYKVNVKASKRGMDAIQIEYKPNGGEWTVLKILMKLPADLVITPQTLGLPESGHIRAIFLKDNEPIGSYSPEYAVTLSA
jgi:hypothetical protein